MTSPLFVPPVLPIQSLPLVRLFFEVRVLDDLALPAYAGSMLRGVFGHSLRKLSCMTRMKTCENCPLLSTCPYSQIFETSVASAPSAGGQTNNTKPYVIEPPGGAERRLLSGATFTFAMVLFGQTVQQLPLIILAWERALQQGLGKHNRRCQLVCVHLGNPHAPVFQSGGPIGPLSQLPRVNTVHWLQRRQIVLKLLSPLRLQQQGKRVGSRELTPRILLMTLARRYKLLADICLDKPVELDFRHIGEVADSLALSGRLRWFDWERFSNRQQQSMTLGGLTGELSLSGELEPLASLLEIGQWLHIGKETTFGLGQYQLQADWSDTAE
jgi:hypothetical protein